MESPESGIVAKTWDESSPDTGNAPSAPPAAAESKGQASPFRPRQRPPTAFLVILDDGATRDGEKRRLRNSRCVIGRKDGDVLIPHDQGVSNRHVELIRRDSEGGSRWELRDLKSTNGTFLRVSRGTLHNGSELLLGGRRFFFRTASSEAGGDAGTRDRPTASPNAALPALIQGRPEKEEKTYALNAYSITLGASDDLAELTLPNDPWLDPVHARIFQDERGRWRIEDLNSQNGIWVRVRHVPLRQNCEFQIGEQRFRFLPAP